LHRLLEFALPLSMGKGGDIPRSVADIIESDHTNKVVIAPPKHTQPLTLKECFVVIKLLYMQYGGDMKSPSLLRLQQFAYNQL
jgi:hypothetical protein